MTTYIIRRLIVVFPILVVITIVNFALMHLAPGEPTDFMLPPDVAFTVYEFKYDAAHRLQGSKDQPEEYRDLLRRRLGLDKPIYVQYFIWIKNLVQGNFGRSMITQTDVRKEMLLRLPVTLKLTVFSLLLSLGVGLVVGILSALLQYSAFDVLSTIGSFLFLSMPGFFFALLAIYFVALKMQWLPPGQMYTVGQEGEMADAIRHMIMPVAVMGLTGSAGFIRFARASMLDVMRADYVTVARSKGLPERIIMVRHAFRNALMPIVTLLSYRLPALFGGSVLIERVFNWPGIGSWSADAALAKDYPIMMATILITAVLTLSANLLADIGYAFVDPRVAYD